MTDRNAPCDLWTLPDLWKAPTDLPTRSLENASGVSHIAHRPYCCLSRNLLEDLKR